MCLTDTDVCGIKVGVSLEYLGPVLDSTVKLTLILVFQSVYQDVAVLGALEDRERLLALVEQKHRSVALVNDSRDLGGVTELGALVAECEEQVTVEIVGKYLAAVLVDYRPCLFRSDCNVGDL